jgi:adenylate kinase family enzyme
MLGTKRPIAGSWDLLGHIRQALTPKRLPLLITIDGADGCGKSSLASWLAWQLEMPTIQLDLYLAGRDPIQWCAEDFARTVAKRMDSGRPVIVEGVLVLEALDKIGRKPDFLVFVSGGYATSPLAPQIAAYQSRERSFERANFVIDGYRE